MKTTSQTRISDLMNLSERIYAVIDSRVDGEAYSRRILRHGIQLVAHTLESSAHHPLLAGEYYHALLLSELAKGGLSSDIYDAWPRYRHVAGALPRPQPLLIMNQTLDTLACAYAAVRRKTISADGSDETNASHAVHLSALALPYAAEYYPDLDQSKIAIYSLIHDIVEAYAGDTPSLGMSTAVEHDKHAREAAALGRITSEFETDFPRFVAMLHDYEDLADAEAKFVKTFDKIDPGFTHFATHGLAFRKHHNLTSCDDFRGMVAQMTERIKPYATEFPEVMEDRLELTERVIAVTPWQ